MTACWNGLSRSDQGSIRAFGRPTDGDHSALATYVDEPCRKEATVAVEVFGPGPPGPRLYCAPCALAYLLAAAPGLVARPSGERPGDGG